MATPKEVSSPHAGGAPSSRSVVTPFSRSSAFWAMSGRSGFSPWAMRASSYLRAIELGETKTVFRSLFWHAAVVRATELGETKTAFGHFCSVGMPPSSS